MNEDNVKLVIGALLHDIGKVVYRNGNDPRKHSQSGADYLRDTLSLTDPEVLESVLYHHAGALEKAQIRDDSNAYLVYMADNITASSKQQGKGIEEYGFHRTAPLQPVFNILNGNHQNKYYSPRRINVEEDINYPVDEKILLDKEIYQKIDENITDNLKGMTWDKEYINSLLEVLEEELSFIPSSDVKDEASDISLYDHLKMTAAIAIDEKEYLQSQGIRDYKKVLLHGFNEFYSVEAFRLAFLDISGIQRFIYTITTKNALKTLRARSFYLEILMEHLIDELLDSLELCRANLIYSGGGHCYLLLPNTKVVEEKFQNFLKTSNAWFIERFGIQLYIAGASVPCSADTLKNLPEGSYENLFHELFKVINDMKNHRYDASQIMALNKGENTDHTRECKVCHNLGNIGENNLCETCDSIEKFSANILYADFFSVIRKAIPGALPLPNGCSLVADSEESLRDRMKNDPDFIRAYGKNKAYTGSRRVTKLWVGNYTTKESFEEFASESTGIKRVGILRADVDNLGTAFISGFADEKNHNRYVTLPRTATFSRQLSLFFKLHINKILAHPQFTLDGSKKDKRNVTIVYSGGDDVFLVGAWNEIIETAVDLRRALDSYTEGTLSISAGIGLYPSGYPISASSVEVEADVDESKSLPDKNAVTLLKDGSSHEVISGEEKKRISDGTYPWKELEDEVIGEKFREISSYFDAAHQEHGSHFLYHLLQLIRNQDDPVNFARYVYLLARMEPDVYSSKEIKEQYRHFKEKMVKWIQNDRDKRQMKTAIELYVYLKRSGEEDS